MRFTVTPVNEEDLNTQTNDEVIEMSVLNGDNLDNPNNNIESTESNEAETAIVGYYPEDYVMMPRMASRFEEINDEENNVCNDCIELFIEIINLFVGIVMFVLNCYTNIIDYISK
ncbi:hypothetical protein DERP_014792 [Dermatophagoides pteronyssinus]|uniref:Uncharacterized protein n=1 Tax=Dermatophagoides pteronyssinus TaxID=6956 RepID=A0ABQ8J2R2_DERPT|nr:hypothetical protein DERP_014792 [Dermatophagoides pteronyssinus]